MNKRKIVNVVAEVLKICHIDCRCNLYASSVFVDDFVITKDISGDHGHSAFTFPEGTAVFKLC